MRDENEAECVLALQVNEQVDDVGLGILVEIARRLVGEQQRGRVDERTRDRNPPLLAAGQPARIHVGAIRESDAREQIVAARVGFLSGHGAAEQRGQGDIVDCGEVRQQARELEHEADIACAEARQFALPKRPDVRAVEHDLAARRLGQSAEHGHQGRFAGAGSSDDRHELAGAHIEISVAYGVVARSGAVPLAQRLRRQGHVACASA